MSALIDFVPRADSSAAAFLDPERLGDGRLHGGRTFYQGLGGNVTRKEHALTPELLQAFGRRMDGASTQDVKDAAADFTTSMLERVLGPGEDVDRTAHQPFLFVPRQGAPAILPSRNTLPPGWRSASYKIRSDTGQARWLEPHAVRTLTYADIGDEKKSYGAHYYGIAYMVTIPETWEEPMLGVSYEADRQAAAVRKMDDFREAASSSGSTERDVEGFLTLGTASIVEGGKAFSASTGAPTAQEQLLLLANIDQLYKRMNKEMGAGALLGPTTDQIAMMNTFLPGTSVTVWQLASQMYPWLAEGRVRWTERLNKANKAGTSSRWIFYTIDGNNLYIEHTETMVFGPFVDRMSTEWVLLRRHGGVISKIPERVMFVDFIP